MHPPVLFIGDRPSRDNIDKDVAFVGSRSYKTLLDWIYRMDVDISKVYLTNAYDSTGNVNTKLYGLNKNWKKIVLGDKAWKCIKNIQLSEPAVIFRMPHPSGLNRTLNDKKRLEIILKKCKSFIYAESDV